MGTSSAPLIQTCERALVKLPVQKVRNAWQAKQRTTRQCGPFFSSTSHWQNQQNNSAKVATIVLSECVLHEETFDHFKVQHRMVVLQTMLWMLSRAHQLSKSTLIIIKRVIIRGKNEICGGRRTKKATFWEALRSCGRSSGGPVRRRKPEKKTTKGTQKKRKKKTKKKKRVQLVCQSCSFFFFWQGPTMGRRASAGCQIPRISPVRCLTSCVEGRES